MADYWKSQAKKYCEFCRCWLADNKPSIEFHEKGRKHQDNVARKLRTITKQSRRDQKEQVRVDIALKRMESAALEAYRKDIESNADLSSKALNESLKQQNFAISSKKIWYEVKSNNEAPSYYWNTETNESVWEAPTCGYLSIADQQSSSLNTVKHQLQVVNKLRKTQDKLKAQEEHKIKEEERAAAEREKMKSRRVQDEVEEEQEAKEESSGAILEPSYGPYGKWKTVETIPKKQVDLQLPKQDEYIAISIPVERPAPPAKLFKEKTISSLVKQEDEVEESAGSSMMTFKKRKFPPKQKRNVRQRCDND